MLASGEFVPVRSRQSGIPDPGFFVNESQITDFQNKIQIQIPDFQNQIPNLRLSKWIPNPSPNTGIPRDFGDSGIYCWPLVPVSYHCECRSGWNATDGFDDVLGPIQRNLSPILSPRLQWQISEFSTTRKFSVTKLILQSETACRAEQKKI